MFQKIPNDIIKSVKSGWYSGKGFKAIKNRRYEKALLYLNIALDNSTTGFEPLLYEALSTTHYNLKNHDESTKNALKSIKQYETINENSKYEKRLIKLHKIIIKNKQNG